MSELMESGLFINGKFYRKDSRIEVKNPFTGETIGMVSKAEKEDVDKAVNSSYKAFKEYGKIPAYRKAEFLRKIADKLKNNKSTISEIITRESGKAIKFSRGEVDRAYETFNFAADEAKRLGGKTITMDAARGGTGRMGFYVRVPLGPVAAITPFNFPLNLAAHKIAPALAGGNTLVWKPSSLTPLTAVELIKIIKDSGIPDGVVNLIFGPGSDAGKSLITHPDIKLISFTGSLEAGKIIRSEAGLKKTLLELGSNSAMVVDKEVNDINKIVERAITGAYANSGQVCISIQRIYVHREIFDDFCSKFVEESKKIKIGDPMDEEVLYGPMITPEEAERAHNWVEEAINEGARPLLRGSIEGSILTPWVLTDVNFKMKVVSREIFAPVVSIMPFGEFDEAIDMVNNSIYGLNAGVYTGNLENAIKAMKNIEVGSVIINDYPTYRVDQMPYGGVKMSGMGREGPSFAIEENTEIRFISMRK